MNSAKVGNFEIYSISDGYMIFQRDLFFPELSSAEWSPYPSYSLPEFEMNIGSFNIKSRCFGKSPDESKNLRMDARYLRKKGQIAINPETQQINSTYFESFTRLEILRVPFIPNGPPTSKGRE